MIILESAKYLHVFDSKTCRKPTSWDEMDAPRYTAPVNATTKKALQDLYKSQGNDFIHVDGRKRPFDVKISPDPQDQLIEIDFEGDYRYYYVDTEGYDYCRYACDVTEIVNELDSEHGGGKWS